GDRAVHPARTRGRRDQDAAPGLVERVRHLHQHAVRLAGTFDFGQCGIFTPRHGLRAAIQIAVAAACRQVGDATPVAPDRTAPEFNDSGMRRVHESRRRHRAQAVEAEAGGQQVVAATVVGAAFGREHRRLRGVALRCARAGAKQQGEGQGGGSCGKSGHAAKVASPTPAFIVLWYQWPAVRRRADSCENQAMPTLLIADDHPLFRAALRQAAADAVDALQVREADSLESVLAALEAEPGIDLVLLDLHMPGNHGLAGLAAIRAQYPGVAVIVVSANDDPRVVRRALDHGAAGYLPKS